MDKASTHDFFSAIFKNYSCKSVNQYMLEIETDKFLTSAQIFFIEKDQYSISVNMPQSYDINTDSDIKDRLINFSYFHDLFHVNPFLFHFDKVKKIILEINKNQSTFKLCFDTSFDVNAVLSISEKKSYLSLNGIIVKLQEKDNLDAYYDEIFSRFLKDKKFSTLKINGIEACRITDFMQNEHIGPRNIMDEHLDIIKMFDI